MTDKTPALRFRLLGFPVRVTPFFFLMSVVLGLPQSDRFDQAFFVQLGLWVVIVKVSILWHEMGHALAMRRYGFEPSITLHWMGGFTQWGVGARRPSAMERVWVSLAGPFAGFLLGLPFLVLLLSVETGLPVVERVFLLMTWVNLGYGALNLIPMLPWDGGLAVHGLLDRITKGRGRLPVAILTIVVAVLAGLAAYQAFDDPIWPLVLCWFSLSAGIREFRAHRAMAKITPTEWLQVAQKALALPTEQIVSFILGDKPIDGHKEVARHLQEQALPRAENPAQRAEIAELLAWSRLLAGQVPEARWAVQCMGDGFTPSVELNTLLALREGDPEAAWRELESGDAEMEDRGLLRAYVLAATGRADEVWDVLDEDRELGSQLDVLLFVAGRFEPAAQIAEALFAKYQNETDAYNAACSHARAGRPDEGLDWLRRAVEHGYDDVAQLEADEDLRSVRELPGGRALIATLRRA